MITSVYTIYDAKAKVYNKPFYQLNEDVMVRTAQDLLTDMTTDVARHPEDFVLYYMGQYDDNKGEFKFKEIKEVMFRFSEINHYYEEQENEIRNEA